MYYNPKTDPPEGTDTLGGFTHGEVLRTVFYLRSAGVQTQGDLDAYDKGSGLDNISGIAKKRAKIVQWLRSLSPEEFAQVFAIRKARGPEPKV